MTLTMYGIKNCDTIKKARTWLADNAIPYDFHDYKALGIDTTHLARWVDAVGWEVLVNRAGTTFRGLLDADKADLNADQAIALMQANPSLIKRPVLDTPGGLIVGFKADRYAQALL